MEERNHLIGLYKYRETRNRMGGNSDNNRPRACKECNAWGKGLVGESGYCNHCTRVLRLNHNPEECEHCLEGYVDITLLADGGVHKKVLHVARHQI